MGCSYGDDPGLVFGSRLAGITSNESLMERTEEILDLSKLESDRLHIEVLRLKHDLLRSVDKPVEAL